MPLPVPMRRDNSSAARRQRRRRTILITTAVFALFLLLGYSSHSLGVLPLPEVGLDQILERTSGGFYAGGGTGNGRASRPVSVRAARRIQNELNAKTSMHPRPMCEWTPWHEARYAPLRDTSRRIVIPMLLHENADLIGTLAQELPVVLEWIGVQNVFVSVFESGSADGTNEYLGDCEWRRVSTIDILLIMHL